MSKFASKVVEQAKAWLGYNEKDGSHKKIIDTYNAHKPLARGYKVKYTDAWCATFVSAVAIKVGYTDIMPTECGCQKMIELLKKIGSWVENENRTPNPGDIIFYDWEDNGVGDNTGHSDHTGIVEKVSNGKITIIEGNYNNAVTRRTLSVNGKYIRGYGVPKYDAEVKPTENADSKKVCTVELKILKKGDKGAQVKAMQILLMGYGFKMENNGKTYGADSSFGAATVNGVKSFQKKNGLPTTGECDAKTWAKLLGVS
jgi:hypothetical protein